jgi:hypothetical protein
LLPGSLEEVKLHTVWLGSSIICFGEVDGRVSTIVDEEENKTEPRNTTEGYKSVRMKSPEAVKNGRD